MRRLSGGRRLAACALLLGLVHPALAAPGVGLTVLGGRGTVCTAPGAGRYVFRRAPESSRPISHTFLLRNGGPVPLTVYNLHSSCGCTSAVVGGNTPPPVTVAPGRTLAVRVTLDSSDLSPGHVVKTVWVEAYAPSGPVPSTQLDVEGDYGTAPGGVGGAPVAAVLDGAAPTEGQIAPAFTLADVSGRTRLLAEFRGRPVALFFFCGCPWCAQCARQWARAARAGSVPGETPALVVFSGDAAAAHRFGEANGLDARRTVLLPDPALAVTERLFHLNSCPRAFVLDSRQAVRYTNDHPGDAARYAPAAAIVARTLAALSALAPENTP